MKKFRKHIKYFGLLVLLSAICTIISCDNSNKPMPFDKEEWLKCQDFGDPHWLTDDYIKSNTRYKMLLWLEQNYNFCDKSFNDISQKFYILPEDFSYGDSLRYEEVLKTKVLKILIKQHNPNSFFDLLTEPYIDTDWIEIYFDENYMVSKVYYVHYNYKTKKKTKREICKT